MGREIVLRRRWAGAVDPFDYAQGSITHPLQKAQRMGHPDWCPDWCPDLYPDLRRDGGWR